LKSAKPSAELRKLLADLQALGFEAHEQALKSFVNKDIGSAETVRQMRKRVEALNSGIEAAAREQPVEVMPQTLAVTAFLKQIFEHSVDLADLVV
jgi:hypothetical protein